MHGICSFVYLYTNIGISVQLVSYQKLNFFIAPLVILINKTINALECDLSQYSQNITVLQSSYDYRALQFLNPNKELKTLSTVSFFAFKLAKAAMTSMLVTEYSAAFSKPF